MLTVPLSDLVTAQPRSAEMSHSKRVRRGRHECPRHTQRVARLNGAATSNYPFAISSSLFTVFQLRVVAFTESAFSNTAFESLVSP